MTALVTITGDGTFRPRGSAEGPALDSASEEGRLAALHELASLLGDAPDSAIATRLYLPMAMGADAADELLPATLALLADTTGDLASYGWRLGTGQGHAWHRAQELQARTLDAARIALWGYEGPLTLTALGPLTLAAATFRPSGERTLSDRGALADLPVILAEGIARQVAAVRERVPGARPHILVREGAAGRIEAGRIPTASGYQRHPAMPAPEIGARWQSLLTVLGEHGIAATDVTLALPPRASLLGAARDAGARRLAVAPRRIGALTDAEGRRAWESLAELHDAGTALELIVDPRQCERDLGMFLEAWTRLGNPPSSAQGLTLLAHEAGPAGHDPAQRAGIESLVSVEGIRQVLRAAPAWAERVQA